jgi:hypothetical protein
MKEKNIEIKKKGKWFRWRKNENEGMIEDFFFE